MKPALKCCQKDWGFATLDYRKSCGHLWRMMSKASRLISRWFDSHAFVGVNGVGKTTSIGVTHKYKQEGKKVMLVAADTFRCGSCRSVGWVTSCWCASSTGAEKADPASVVFDGGKGPRWEGSWRPWWLILRVVCKIKTILWQSLKDWSYYRCGPRSTLMKPFWPWDASTGQNALVRLRNLQKLHSYRSCLDSSWMVVPRVWFQPFAKSWIFQLS